MTTVSFLRPAGQSSETIKAAIAAVLNISPDEIEVRVEITDLLAAPDNENNIMEMIYPPKTKDAPGLGRDPHCGELPPGVATSEQGEIDKLNARFAEKNLFNPVLPTVPTGPVTAGAPVHIDPIAERNAAAKKWLRNHKAR